MLIPGPALPSSESPEKQSETQSTGPKRKRCSRPTFIPDPVLSGSESPTKKLKSGETGEEEEEEMVLDQPIDDTPLESLPPAARNDDDHDDEFLFD